MPDPSPLLDIQTTVASWRRVPRLRARLQKAAQATLAHLPQKLRFPVSATILLAGNAKVRQLNNDFRGIDKPTNVLSFPQFSPADLPRLGKRGEIIELGDIAIAYQYVVAEAKADNKLLTDHLTHLIIHGLLHLFGYNHLNNRDAEQMENLETKIMNSLGLPDPYAPQPAPHKRRKS
ncbi:MAG: rRNA maturation RNase YbeY [Alphaproteobacteria bacterium]|nr:rRNA maturation RNase YbeY [Alphaproteobacteria bacterium]